MNVQKLILRLYLFYFLPCNCICSASGPLGLSVSHCLWGEGLLSALLVSSLLGIVEENVAKKKRWKSRQKVLRNYLSQILFLDNNNVIKAIECQISIFYGISENCPHCWHCACLNSKQSKTTNSIQNMFRGIGVFFFLIASMVEPPLVLNGQNNCFVQKRFLTIARHGGYFF